jgi:hypothetical protein
VLEVGEFYTIKTYLEEYYSGQKATLSFTDSTGQVWDCIPIEQQISLKGKKIIPAKPKTLELPSHQTQNIPKANLARPQFGEGQLNPDGKEMKCPDGFIPQRRITPEEVIQFGSLAAYLKKAPRTGTQSINSMTDLRALEAQSHKYAFAPQAVTNLGGHSFLNIWTPKLKGDEIFSLSQHWYTSGNNGPLQTVEGGWQVFPSKYQTNLPCLFIYWTADGYGQTGCYNLDGPGFVQTNNKWGFGGALPVSSIPGGVQYDLQLTWNLHNGNWWLYLNGTAAADAIGYYPAAIYKGGYLSRQAADVDYGGETVGVTSWPEMGSGQPAAAGYQHAAYQRNIFYFGTDGKPNPANVQGTQPSPACYSIQVGHNSNWNTFFFYGGHGGTGC